MQNNWLQMSVLMTHSPISPHLHMWREQVWRMCCGSSCVQYVNAYTRTQSGFILTRIEYISC